MSRLGLVQSFQQLFGTKGATPQVAIDGDDPGDVEGVHVEAYLDIEVSGAVAPQVAVFLGRFRHRNRHTGNRSEELRVYCFTGTKATGCSWVKSSLHRQQTWPEVVRDLSNQYLPCGPIALNG